MENIKLFLKIDLNVQRFLLFFTCLSLILFPFIGFMLCILGGWQLLSAVVIGYKLKDKKRGKYFGLSVLYLLFMWGAAMFFSALDNDFGVVALAIIFILIPIFIALWYMELTSKTLKAFENEEYIYSGREGLEDILDSEELLERRAILDL